MSILKKFFSRTEPSEEDKLLASLKRLSDALRPHDSHWAGILAALHDEATAEFARGSPVGRRFQLVRKIEQLFGGMGMGSTFAQFANMFLAKSQFDLPVAVGLSTPADSVAAMELMTVFPSNYRPTLKEFLDAIALQTKTEWKYVTESASLRSYSKDTSPVDGVACFEFSPCESRLDFTIRVPAGWTIRDGGNRLMCRPPTFPVGIDFYEVGGYSFEAGAALGMNDIVEAVALEWAGRAKSEVKKEDLVAGRVGEHPALYFETRVPSRLGMELIWRQWVFSSGDRCYFVISTLDDANTAQLKSQVDDILQSFEKKPPNQLPTPI